MQNLSIKDKKTSELLLSIDNEQSEIECTEELINRMQGNEDTLYEILDTIDKNIQNKNTICNLLSVLCFQRQAYDFIIPLLQKSLEYDPTHTDSLFNLSIFLKEIDQTELALHYANQIRNKSEEVLDFIQALSGVVTSANSSMDNILQFEQNDVPFSGERLIINQEVKGKYNDVLEEHIYRYRLACNYVKGKNVLDAACGAGYGSKMLQQAGANTVVGLDISEESLLNATRDYSGENIQFTCGDVNHLDYQDASFDVVVSFETIEHIEDGSQWIRESARVLKDEGIFLVSTPNRKISNPGLYFCEKPINPYHHFEYSITEFIGELLKEYEIIELFGQTFTDDIHNYYSNMVRHTRKLEIKDEPSPRFYLRGHQLLPLGEIKDAEPNYVVAVCRKKRTA